MAMTSAGLKTKILTELLAVGVTPVNDAQLGAIAKAIVEYIQASAVTSVDAELIL